MTTQQAQALVGKVGKIKASEDQAEWQGDYRVTGFHTSTTCDGTVTHLIAESVETLPAGEYLGTRFPERPKRVANRFPAAWFTENE